MRGFLQQPTITLLVLLLIAPASGCQLTGTGSDNVDNTNDKNTVNIDALEQQVFATERAFAQTMADRDHEAFTGYLAEHAVFFNGETPLRGKAAVTKAWQPFFTSAKAPFSWQPLTVVVVATGDLALSTGPVLGPDGKQVATFNSIWQRQASGEWRIVFDKGS